MFRFGILLGILGIVLLVFGVNEYRLSSAAKSTPQTITCEQLAASGPGDNAYVTLTSFEPSMEAFVCQHKENTTAWDHVWIPLYPAKSGEAAGAQAKTNFKVILDSTKYTSQSDLDSLLTDTEVHGMIINKISSLGAKERGILEENYPGVDINSVWILQQDRVPKSTGTILAMIAGGVVLTLGGAALLFKKFIFR